MIPPTIGTVAVIGTGVIGRSWIRVFAQAGCETRVYDLLPAQVEQSLQWLEQSLRRDEEAGIITADEAAKCRSRVTPCFTIKQALAGVAYVQESGPELIAEKQAIFAELDINADPDTILGSSTSVYSMTAIAGGLQGASRAIVAHPVNPPHVIPVVEVVPGELTGSDVVERTCEFLASIGQSPVLLNKYIPGFLLNRMQAALIREAIYLVEAGIANVDAIDTVIRDGLGLRWALLGPFGVAHTNADGGVREYFSRYGESYSSLMNSLGPTPSFRTELVEQLGEWTEMMFDGCTQAEALTWRDRMIWKFRRAKEADPLPCGSPAVQVRT